jgi:hypothetical protein
LSLPSEVARRTRTPAYAIACLLFLIPLIEIVVSASPFRIHDPNWRIALVSAGANASTTILLGLLLAYLVGAFTDDRLTVWVVAVVSTLMVLACVGGSGAFALDALQMRAQVRPGLEERYNLTSAWALGKIVLVGLGAAVLSVSAFRNARSARREYERRGKKSPTVLVGSSAPITSGPNS